jgi:hypothetical protein
MPLIYPTLTLRQPYASLKMTPHKPSETRSWPAPKACRMGQIIAIHAGLTPVASTLDEYDVGEETVALMMRCLGITDLRQFLTGLSLGAVVGICCFTWCYRTSYLDMRRPDIPEYHDVFGPECHDRELGDFSPGRYAWVMNPIRLFDDPVPAKGKQGVWGWEMPEDLHEQLIADGDILAAKDQP